MFLWLTLHRSGFLFLKTIENLAFFDIIPLPCGTPLWGGLLSFNLYLKTLENLILFDIIKMYNYI